MEKKIDTGQIFSEAFDYWKSVMRFNIVFSVLYFGLFMLLTYGLASYLGVWNKFMELQSVTDMHVYLKKLTDLLRSEDVILFSTLSVICSGLVFPLHIGFFKIFSKIDNKEEPSFSDLFEGYQGVNFIKYATYYIFWMMIYRFMSQLVLPAPFWVMLTLFVSPLMYFRNEPLGTALVWSFQVMRRNFLLLFICVIGTAFISYLGLLVFFVGYAFTFPFWNAVIYTLYKQIFIVEKDNNLQI